MKAILASMWTSVTGALVAICGGATLLDWMPENWQKVAGGVCMVLIGIGLIKAKDANVSNSGTNAAPHVVEVK